jgi:hypothetical protein
VLHARYARGQKRAGAARRWFGSTNAVKDVIVEFAGHFSFGVRA